ncbi:MAG: DUF86 domain-containing protein [Cyanobacteriota bacterium]
MRNDDLIRLRHILDAAIEAQGFVCGRTREELEDDRQLTWALVKAIEIIGEAAGQLSEEAKAEIPNIPWRNIIGMRHRLVHAYFDINLDILWRTVIDGVPTLSATIKQVLAREA